MLLDVSYVGNRGAWWYAGALRDVNALTPQDLQSKYGLDINNAADRTLLVGSLSNAQKLYPGRFPTPFAGFPMTATLVQAISLNILVHFPATLGSRTKRRVRVKSRICAILLPIQKQKERVAEDRVAAMSLLTTEARTWKEAPK